MFTRKIIVILAILVSMGRVALGTMYYVDPNGSDDANGLSWETAFATIQHGIDTANNGDTVDVNEGTYYESLDFTSKNIIVHSIDPCCLDVVQATVIDGNEATNTVVMNSPSGCSLNGITVTGGTCGVYCCTGTSALISNCIIRDNADEGIYINQAYLTAKNSLIYGNDTGIKTGPCGLKVCNCTIVNNDSYGVRNTYPYQELNDISNCILWNNNDDLYDCCATYSCIEDGDSGTGNIISYPYFADYDSNDFHLTFNSPCINRGDPNGDYDGQVDIDGEGRVADDYFVDERVDIGADEFNTHNINLVKNPGFEDGFGDEWVHKSGGNGTATIVDYDCYEGDYCLRMDRNDSKWQVTDQNMGNLSPEKYYLFSAVFKTSTAHIGCISLYDSDWQYPDPYDPNVPDPNKTGKSFSCKAYGSGSNEWVKVNELVYIPLQDDYGNSTEEHNWLVRLYGSYSDTIFYDSVKLTLATEFLPSYGCVNEPNLAWTVKFGENGLNEDLVVGTITTYMSGPYTDPNDENITYRELKVGQILPIEFPAFNLDPNEPNFPSTPMLLEIMFKDTVKVNVAYYTSYYQVFVSSKIDYINLDPDYNIENANRDYHIANIGGRNDNHWKYIQYAFQESDYQLIRAINNKFTIKIRNNTGSKLPIDYVSLRTITQVEYEKLADKQRDVRNFKEVQLPTDAPSPPVEYDDPNLTVFVRDIMQPVYRHTKPDADEPNSITSFSCWGEVEAASFSIYSESGANDITISVSNLTHTGGSDVIDGNNISIYHVIYDETRLEYTGPYGTGVGYALQPDRLESSASLSIYPNSSKRIWLKIYTPDSDQGKPAGLYEGNVILERAGKPDVYVPINFTIYDVALAEPNHINRVADKNAYKISSDFDEALKGFAETCFDPYVAGFNNFIVPYMTQDGGVNIIDFNTTKFENYLDKLIAEDFIREGHADRVCIALYREYSVEYVWNAVYKTSYEENDPCLYYRLSEPCEGWPVDIGDELVDPNWTFPKAYKELINKYIEIGGDACGVTFIFGVNDEPGLDARMRIEADRLNRLIQDCNAETTVTYYATCDLPLPTTYNNKYYGLGDFNVPDGTLPPLTDLIGFKTWAIGYEGIGYENHQDPCYHGQFGYYTTGHSHYRNPVYNRFLHGLFAFGTDATIVHAYAMGDYINDPYNDFDSGYEHIFPFTYPDFLYAYPTWSGELLYTIGGLEAIREGIKDAKYIATLKNLIDENPNDAVAVVAQDYLDEVKGRIDPNYPGAYSGQSTALGYYEAILEGISEEADPNDFEAFTEIREQLIEFIVLLADSNSYAVWNKTQNKFYTTIQGGINDASSGDELIVAQGTHYESVDFSGKAITVRGADQSTVESIIIDANGADYTVVFDSSEDTNSVLTGVTVTGALYDGIYCSGSSPSINGCIIRDNAQYGVNCSSSSPVISSCIISGNNRGVTLNTSAPEITNCTIVDNDNFGIFADTEQKSPATVTNCIIWNNVDDLKKCNATYSCIKDGDAGTGNISDDPLFVDDVNNDFHLQLHSPCLNAGDPNFIPDANETDIDGDDRVINGTVDMGADEISWSALAHWWKLDEDSGTTAYDFIDDDNGSFNGTEPNWVDGLIGGAIECNGVSDYFSIPDLNNAYSSTSTFTVAGWFKTSQSTGIQTIVGQWRQEEEEVYPGVFVDMYIGWQVLVESNKVVARFGQDDDAPTNITGTSDVNDGNWHHFALVYPTSSSNATLYVEGQQDATPATNIFYNNDTKFRIGDGSYVSSGNPTPKGKPFNGTIDDVMIFERALSAEEVQQLYDSGGL